jgi:hypothetical protein
MRKLLLASILVLSLPTAAAARPTLALRLGYELARGKAAEGTPMSEVAKSQIPLQLDALWRFGPHFSGGVYASYGFARLDPEISDRCDALGASCSAWTARLGVQASYAFAEFSKRYTPWLGGGVGYEWVRQKISGALSGSETVSGWDFVLDTGFDVKVSPTISVGPYFALHFGPYTRLDGYAIPSKAVHEWLAFGLRGRYDF